ncbi:MAG: hypothetical protein LBJ00_13720 [Planctomycetaceae bacterium]|nr:hypothetical protein [Planctomycetaceae bacterium]
MSAILRAVFVIMIIVAFIVCASGTLKSQGFDVLRLASTHINAEVNLQDGNEIYQSGNSVQLRVTGSLTLARNFSPIRTTPPKITRNLIIHVGVYQIPEPNGLTITPESKRSDTSKKTPEYENEFPITISTDSPYNFPVTFLAPQNDGVYEIIVSFYAQGQPSLPRSFSKPDIEIVKQIVIVNSAPKRRSLSAAESGNLTFDKELIEQNNTQKNEWWKPNLRRLPTIPTPKLPSFIDRSQATNTTPASNFRFAINKNSLAPFFEQYINQITNLAESNNNNITKTENNYSILHPSDDKFSPYSWNAIPLNLHEIGKPHLIEIDYPLSASQKLEIAVVEAIDGEHVVSAESCIHVTETVGQAIASAGSEANNTHKILFWSKTKTPTLLLMNRTGRNCIFGNVKLYKITSDSISRQYKFVPKRLVAGYLNKPEMLLQLASTVEKTDTTPNPNSAKITKIPARDWQTLYESANRLVEILHWNGFDGVMLNVASNEAILYRSDSAKLESPRDMLELLHKLFDRETFSLIPAVNFNMRLPKIDSIIRNNPQLAYELLQFDTEPPSNQSEINVTINNNETDKSKTRYNFLHPIVKETLLNTIREITTRYGTHRSFGGIGVILAHDSHTLLNDPFKSLDDRTIREFTRETGIQIPEAQFAEIRDRIEARAIFLRNNNATFDAFVNWRNVKVKEFYQEVVKTITDVRRDARLYLAADTILDRPEVKKFCLPSLPRSGTVLLSQRLLGYDPALICDIPSVTFLRPSRRSPDMQNESAAVYSDFDVVNTGAQFIRNEISFGTLFFDDFDQSPSVPPSIHNRSRFVKQLAQSDVAMFFDGGNSLLSGENDSLRELLAVFRQLPALPFKTFSYPQNQSVYTPTSATINPTPNASTNPSSTLSSSASSVPDEKSLQPVTVRYVNNGLGLFVYIVNDAPFEVRVDVGFSVAEGAGFYELSGQKKCETRAWNGGRQTGSFRVEAYNLTAVYVHDAAAFIENVEVLLPEHICGANGILHKRVKELGQRIQIARSGIKWNKLNNTGFDEERGERDFKKTDLPQNILQNSPEHINVSNYEYSEYHGWQALSTNGASANIDRAVKHEGNASLRLSSTGTDKNICVSSDPFEIPTTGRLFVSLFVGIKDFAGQNRTGSTNLPVTTTTISNKSTVGIDTPLLFQLSIVGLGGVEGNNGNSVGSDKLINRTFNMDSLLKPVSRGASVGGGVAVADGVQWFKVVIPFEQLPMSTGNDVVLRFNLIGSATVWVDDITLYQVAFTPEETNELLKLLSAADVRRAKYRVSDLLRLFDSYWAQFLLHNIPDPNNTTPPANITTNNSPNNISPNTKIASLQKEQSIPNKPTKTGILQRVKSWVTWK